MIRVEVGDIGELRRYARARADEWAASVRQQREAVILASDAAQYFHDGMSQQEMALMRRWLVKMRLATWVVPREDVAAIDELDRRGA